MIIGITGQIATGKSTVRNILKEYGYETIDADEIVHNLYNQENIILEVQKIYPDAIIDNKIDRKKLRNIFKFPEKLKELESLIHPKVREEELAFIKKHKKVAIEISLLFQTEFDKYCDYIIVTKADKDIQKHRLEKRGLDLKTIETILEKQKFNPEWLAESDLVIDTSESIEEIYKKLEFLK